MVNPGISDALQGIEEVIFNMAAFVEELIAKAIQAMNHADDRLADEVIASDHLVDDMRAEVRQRVIVAIEAWAPVGVDLRKLLAYQRIGEQIERVGDYAVHLARGAHVSYRTLPLEIVGSISEMATLVRQQVRDGVQALADGNEGAARRVCADDNGIDQSYRTIFAALQDYMRTSPQKVMQATLILFAIRDLERIGDRMASINEDVIYMLTGAHEELN